MKNIISDILSNWIKTKYIQHIANRLVEIPKNYLMLVIIKAIGWLRNFITLLPISILVACQSYPVVQETVKKDANIIRQQPFYTYPYTASANLRNKFDAVSYKSLRLDYENGCVYLFDGNQHFVPLFPQEYTFWNENKHALDYYDNTFRPGYIIESVAYELTPQQRAIFEKEFVVSKPPRACTDYPMLYIIGTPPGVISPEMKQILK